MLAQQWLKQSEKFITDHGPVLLTGAAITGTLSTAYLSATAGHKSGVRLHLEENADSRAGDPPFTTKEKALLVWKLYIPTAGAVTVTVASIVFAHRVSASRAAAMVAAYSLSEKKFSEYRDKVIEKIGKDEEKDVQAQVTQERIRQAPRSESIFINSDDVPCFDSYSGRYFKSSTEAIRGAVNDVNFEVIRERYQTLEDFWEIIGLEQTAYSGEFGWTVDSPLEVEFSTMMSSDDRPCMVITYDVMPIRRYNHIE